MIAFFVVRTLYPDITPEEAADVVLPHDRGAELARSNAWLGSERGGRRGEQLADACERAGRDAEVGELPAPLARDDPGVEQLLEVVAGRGLLEPEQLLEVADADGLAAGGEQAVEDLHAVAVGRAP